ncbi:MAG: hypothetical protein ACKVQR_23795 [Aquabacterium sp.]
MSVWAMVATAGAQPDDGLRRCRSLADAAARLACYDALADATAAARAGGAAGAATTAAATAAASPLVQTGQFGLEQRTDELAFIESSIAGRFEGWGARSMFRLANGQIWQIADDSEAFAMVDNPRVRIRRGALSSYYLEVEGVRRAPRVRRVH